ncbi:helix-turn-helix domain-containing protein [Thalassobacillus hwangdonensis]|uniref:Helix-turn-helix domain-containing protein n=1 Tax=Thalassobacillus hwangdonensis TaxID=546108 RepID=A0ABW3L5Q4_9BACI
MNGSTLKQIRNERGLSISKLSSMTGISKSYISCLERDVHKNPSIDIIEKIAHSLRVDVDQLLCRDGEKKPKKPHTQGFLQVEVSLSDYNLDMETVEQLEGLVIKINR